MDGIAKKIIVFVMAAVIVISGAAMVLSLKHDGRNKGEQPEESVLYSGMNVTNPLRTVDKNDDNRLDAVENADFSFSYSDVYHLLDENRDGVPDTLEIAEQGYQELPENESSTEGRIFAVTNDSYIPGSNEREYLKPGHMEDRAAVIAVFPGYENTVQRSMERQSGIINLQKRIRNSAYHIPLPDLQWLESQGNIRRFLLPIMQFGPHGFNWTEFNVTKFKHVVRYDNNSDGNAEYYREVSYLNLTQDDNGNGVYEVRIMRYHMMMYRDNNSDGNREYRRLLDALCYEVDANEDNVSEERAVVAIERLSYDNNSDGNVDYFHARAVGNETVDENENGIYEFHMVMVGNAVIYDNNSNGNVEYAHAYFASRAVEDENEDNSPNMVAVSVTGYKRVDRNDDGHPEYTKYIHWRYCKKDSDNDGKIDSMRAMEAQEVYYDNRSSGHPEYVDAKIRGLVYKDTNGDGRNESVMKGIAEWKVINRDGDENNDTVEFRMMLVNRSSPLEDGSYANAGKLYISYTMTDNNSDGNAEHQELLIAGYRYRNATAPNGTGATYRAVLYTHFNYTDENSDGNPEKIVSRAFYREQWDENRDGIYERERGFAERGYRYDNSSNGVFERRALKMFGYLALRNSTNENITELHLVALCGNATNVNDSGIAEFQNHTFLVVHRIDRNGSGNPEYVEVKGVRQRQYLNTTGLINVTVMGRYWYRDSNDNGLRDRYVMEGVKILRIDFNLDGTWDEVITTLIYHSGSDE